MYMAKPLGSEWAVGWWVESDEESERSGFACDAYRPAKTVPMKLTSLISVTTCFVALIACQSDQHAAESGGTKRVATRPASMSTAGSQEVRLSVPRLSESGVAEDLRQALSALPQVTQVLPNLSSNEIVVRTSEMVPAIQFQQVLQSLGLRGTVR